MKNRVGNALKKFILCILYRIRYTFYLVIDLVFSKLYYKLKSKADEYDLRRDLKKRICVVAPHIDDEILGVCGIIKEYLKMGNDVTVLYATDGRKSKCEFLSEEEMRLERIREAYEIKRKMVGLEIIFMDLKSMSYSQNRINEKMDMYINSLKPDIVFFPFIIDENLDHIMVAKAILNTEKNCSLRMYSVQTPIPIGLKSMLVNIDSHYEEKTNLVKVFQSQMIMKKSFDKVLMYNRVMGRKIGAGSAENFWILEKSDTSMLKQITIKNHHIKRITNGGSILIAMHASRKLLMLQRKNGE